MTYKLTGNISTAKGRGWRWDIVPFETFRWSNMRSMQDANDTYGADRYPTKM